ncbi:flagellar hook assembly protein FlgD [Microbulbifer thermotolerans]|uniref:Basal-body rod modification protein FlgD n=1 Tax=Microbulbifer thermotolerans TaxID=252514 RepID=A0A143HN99_MICTH|nr:flagellar hook assembly protein FlgD [Microbulbifer thermotolerans]AMX03189.1 flagellar basal body rod modification protein [Microbulbifer thermotolerans]MCX2783490.1 flagellar hook assembly protein FlgD [Microbulbifer thermotolerans]MCX2795884.1 flagellar hook assembly protein FlgD [Microbulbifer thermotolerans]MCX2835542.1 flagellar hook assembly protein FlgD [Microbulbifer thermotolerans]SFC61492.1 flagellar basal-body rod modification protein FlgD [Microbulbifer thermotolerans]
MAVTNVIDSAVRDALNTTAGASTQNAGLELQESFMTLLVAQLQNQDPMNPMENAEMTSQLAQINTVTGIQNLNDTLEGITGQLDASQLMQATSLIGKGVLVPGDRVLVGEEGVTTPFGIELPAGADDVRITIRDGNGEVVRSFEPFSLSAGTESFTWDGTTDEGTLVAEGAYTVSVQAYANGEPVDATVLNYALVNGVSLDDQGAPLLDLGGVSEPVDLSDIRQIL